MDFVQGGGGGSVGSTMVQLECLLIDRNGGMSGGNGQWINLGIIPALSSQGNLWCRIPPGFRGSSGGPGGSGPRRD